MGFRRKKVYIRMIMTCPGRRIKTIKTPKMVENIENC